MDKKLQVFVSSTYTDLIEERQAAVAAILDAGHIPAGMELFKAGKSQMKTIQKWIDESDVYMLILGGRYGSIEEESGLSYTELEYKYALSKNMPVFGIVLDDSFLHIKASSSNANSVFEKENTAKYDSFKKYVLSKIVKFAKNADQLSSIIHSQLNKIVNDNDYNLIGWTKNTIEKNTFNYNHTSSMDLKTPAPLKIPILSSHQMSVLAVMPFTETWSEDVYCIIKKACEDANVQLNKADEFGSHFIYDDTITGIRNSDLIIADVTGRNAIVFYELGYAHALGKNVILIRQSDTNVPFDIAQIRYLTYELTLKKAIEFQKYLTDTINLYKNNL